MRTSAGDISTERLVLTGGPTLAAVGALSGLRIPAGGARHQVVVTEDHPDLAADRLPMVFDLASGIYWRPEEGGIMWGMSNPAEQPGVCHEFDWDYYEQTKAADGRARPDHGQARAAAGVGGDHRLHAGPPADPRPGPAAVRRAGRAARSSHRRAATG